MVKKRMVIILVWLEPGMYRKVLSEKVSVHAVQEYQTTAQKGSNFGRFVEICAQYELHWKCVSYLLFVASLGNHVMLHLDCFLTSLFENSIHGWSHTKQEGGAATDILLLASAPVDLVFRNRVDGLGTEPLVSGHTFP